MYLSNVSIPEECKFDDFVYEGLKKGNYKIIYKFNKETEVITFEAFLKYRSIDLVIDLSFIKLEVAPFGLILNPYNLGHEQIALLKFILEYYDGLSDEEKVKEFAPINEFIEPIKELSVDELTSRNEIRENFANMLKRINKSVELNNVSNGVYSLRFTLLSSDDKYSLINSKFSLYNKEKDKEFFANDYNKLASTYIRSEIFDCGQFKVLMKDESFDEVGKALLNIFIFKRQYEYNCYSTKDVFYALEVYAKYGIGVYYKNQSKPYSVKFVEKPDIIFDENGDMTLSPKINSDDVFSFSKYGYILINKAKNIVTAIKFPDETYYYLYDFVNKNHLEDFKHVKDLVSNRLIPLVETKSTIDDKYKQKISSSVIKICLFADLEQEKLVLKTKYFVGTDEISLETANKNTSYQNKILNYELALRDFNLVSNGTIDDEDIIFDFLTKDLSAIKKYAEILLSDEFSKLKVKKLSGISISSSFKLGMLNLKITNEDFDQDDVRRILEYYKNKKKFIVLKDSIISLDSKEIEELIELDKDFDIKEEEKEVPLYEIFKLSSYKDTFNINFDDKIVDILNEIKDFKKSKFKPLPIFKNVLRKYQLQAFQWLMTLEKYNLGGILADDMGLGKTLEMISFISSVDKAKPILIICPKSLTYNWEHEFKMWNPEIKVVTVAGEKDERVNKINLIKNDEKVVYVTPYDSLRNDISLYENVEFSLIILDEAQYIKNSNALKTKAIKTLKSDNRFVLTGTPIENSLTDLWSIFDFLMPGYLYSFETFKQKFESTILKGDEDQIKRLQAKINPFILRRVKKDVLKDLPPKTETVQICDMKKEQRQIYDAHLLSARKDFMKDQSNKISALAALMRLRQICVDPSMFIDNYEDISEKLEHALQLVNDAISNGHKVLVFSSFTKSLEHFRELLNDNELSSYYICGDTPAKNRLMYCELFNKTNDVKVFLISLKAGGTGLNLTGADIIIHLDPWWNVAAENQASDRAHRIGQTRPVTVIKLVTKDSVEEKVIELQDLKKDLMDNFIGNGDKGANFLSVDDIKFLLE